MVSFLRKEAVLLIVIFVSLADNILVEIQVYTHLKVKIYIDMNFRPTGI